MRTITMASLLALAFLLPALATNAATAPAPPATTDQASIAIKDFMFMSVTVKAGATVTWTNEDDEPHNVVSDTRLFRSGALDTGDSFAFTFSTPGVYHYVCSIHPRMLGTVIVK